jgi:hypothetical protein
MPTTVISGTGQRAERLADRLRAAGHDVDVLSPDRATTPDPDSVDHYLQLPVAVTLTGDNMVARVHSFLDRGLMARFGLVERVLPGLRKGAGVVLVTGNSAVGAAVPDDEQSRLALLHVLAHALRAELAGREASVRVVDGDLSDDELVAGVLAGRDGSEEALADVTAIPSGKQYEDWRSEVMGMVHPIVA